MIGVMELWWLQTFSYVFYFRPPSPTIVRHVIYDRKVNDMFFSYCGQHIEVPDSI